MTRFSRVTHWLRSLVALLVVALLAFALLLPTGFLTLDGDDFGSKAPPARALSL